ncbi:MAG: nucleotide pyrophosphatase, partial [bacterium]
KRGLNVNAWLKANGFLKLKEGVHESGEYFQGVDWDKTKAYAFGLAGIYINLKGREKKGIVEPGEEQKKLKEELIARLSGLKDPQTGNVAITEMFDSQKIYKGPYVDNGPDLITGYNVGYRISWHGATGVVNDQIFEDNVKAWSGDHCIDPRLVPGVIFSNKTITAANPALIDIAPTVLDLFGISKPSYMQGNTILDDQVEDTAVDLSTPIDDVKVKEQEVVTLDE